MAAVESRDDSGASELSESAQSKDSKNSCSPTQSDSRSWLVGDVVWSKIPGHPWWPSMVSYDPNTAVCFKYKGRARYYHVQFFGQDPVRGWVAERSILKFEGRQHFENSFHGKQLKITPKRITQWENAVKVAEKAKPMNRHERQLCYTFKYYDKNDVKRLDPAKLRNLNGVSPLPEQVNGVISGHGNGLSDFGDSPATVPSAKITNGHLHSTVDFNDDEKKNGKEKSPRKRKRNSVALTSETMNKSLVVTDRTDLPRKKKKRTERANGDLSFSSSVIAETSNEKIDITSSVDLPAGLAVTSELNEKCNNLLSGTVTCAESPPRVNGDASFSPNSDLSPNTALKLKIRKIQPKPNPVEGKRKRGRPRKPRFVIVSEEENETSVDQPKVKKQKVLVKKVLEKKDKGKMCLPGTSKCEQPQKKQRGRKPKIPVLNETPSDTKLSLDIDNKDAEQKDTKEEEISKPNVTTEPDGSIASSSIDDDSGSSKNGVALKREKEAVCIVCEQQENLIFCEGVCGNAFHLDCIGLSVVPKGKFVCDECVTGNHCCFVCRQTGNVKQCHHPLCSKHYHEDCLKTFKTAKFDGDRFFCPLHFCSTCVTNKVPVTRGRMIRCVRCPTAYHLSGCLVAGCVPINSHLMVCAKHFLREKTKAHHTHVNVNWCFVCSIGGTLICCESCPAAFHPECISYEGIPEGHFFCKDCAEGKQLLYGDIVWVKLGMYRWWPAQICNPRDVPTNIQNMRHQPGEFPVMFLGSHDYYWIHKGRVFSYQEGDKGSTDGGSNKHLAKIFKLALVEAKEKYAEWRTEQENKAEQDLQKMSRKPAPYKQIKVNKWTSAIRTVIDPSELPTCDCSPNSENPCGPELNCLNRMLQFECNPSKCPAKELCHNQRFQKRQYVECEAFRTMHRGWGLRCKEDLKKGQFVIEYVGELIDEATCQERVRKGEDITNYYMLTIDKDCIIDAGPMGNLSRFMNHSCDPNCETQKWTVNGEVRVGLFASRNIKGGEELTFDYQLDCLGNEKKKCHCGAPNCSSFLGVRPKNQVQEEKVKKVGDKRKKRKPKKPVVKEVHEDDCFLCGDGGELLMCDKTGCSKCYHQDCLSGEVTTRGKWICPWHFCDDCGKWATMLCAECPNSYCRSHAEGQVTELASGSWVCSDHIVTRTKTSHMNQAGISENEEEIVLEPFIQ